MLWPNGRTPERRREGLLMLSKRGSARRSELTLKEWLDRSEFQGNVGRFAEALAVPRKTAEDWVYRGRRPSVTNGAKIAGLTGIEEFAALPPEKTLGPKETARTLQRVDHTKRLLLALHEELTFFKNNSAQHREILRKNMDGQYVAYVTSLFQLMFNEERFQDWLHTSRLTR